MDGMDQIAVTNQPTREERLHNVLIMGTSAGGCFFIGLWVATQVVASACGYNHLLGRYIDWNGWHIYSPFMFFIWQMKLDAVIPDILAEAEIWLYAGMVVGFVGAAAYIKHKEPLITHGSARWATKKEIVTAGLTNNPGVILGLNPFTHKFLRDDGPTHIFLMAPTRSGKGICVIIPTLLTWTHSVFVTDVKGENWEKSAGFRKDVMHQKCIKFAPLESDGSSAKWNPLAEIRMKTLEEASDVESMSEMLINPYGTNKPGDYWPQAGKVLLKGAILHHLYWYEKEGRKLPNLTNILTFLSSINEALPTMASYPHISMEEFMEEPNIFQKCYTDDYMTDFSSYVNAIKETFGEEVEIKSLAELKACIDTHPVKTGKERRRASAIAKAQAAAEEAMQAAQDAEADQQACEECVEAYASALAEAKAEFKNAKDDKARQEACKNVLELTQSMDETDQKSSQLYREARELEDKALQLQKEYQELEKKYGGEQATQKAIDFEDEPWCYLLVHPKVRECAMSMMDKAEAEMSGVQSTVLTALNIYQNPIVQINTSVSDFRIKDLLDANQALSFYLVIPPNDITNLTPLVRLFINLMFNKLIRDMVDEHVKGCKRQRLLLMLDEFAQFGKIDTIDPAMAVCASFGIKMCIVSQNFKQLYAAYGKDQSIMANCHVQVYFTPNQDGGDTAEAISKQLGKTTIKVSSHSDGGGGFFKGSNTVSGIARDLMTPDEVSNHFPYEKEIVMVTRSHPIYGDKLMYYKDKRFVDRSYSKDAPNYPPPLYSDTFTRTDSFQAMHELQRAELEQKAKDARKIAEAKQRAAEAAQTNWNAEKPTGQDMDKMKKGDLGIGAQLQELIAETEAEICDDGEKDTVNQAS